MQPKVYIDGEAGTTGLQIQKRLQNRTDIALLQIDPAKRKDVAERKKMLNLADLVFLCLPDDAAREAVQMIENPTTRVIDASTAHRTSAGWVYGFPELSDAHRMEIIHAKRVANPGCHATGFLSIVYPLVTNGVIQPDTPLTCFSLTGYSGGGKQMIAAYEQPEKPELLYAPRIYGLHLQHKHLPEMQKIAGLSQPPLFCPVVDDYKKGMATTILLHRTQVGGRSAAQVQEVLEAHYAGKKWVTVAPDGMEIGMISANAKAGKDSLTLFVYGHMEQVGITALFDNLGKGASGAAVQNMNLMLGLDENAYLVE